MYANKGKHLESPKSLSSIRARVICYFHPNLQVQLTNRNLTIVPHTIHNFKTSKCIHLKLVIRQAKFLLLLLFQSSCTQVSQVKHLNILSPGKVLL